MKTKATFAIALLLVIFCCDNDNGVSIPKIEGLSLYWDHEVFDEKGRSLRFEATAINKFDNEYDLVFNTSRDGTTITVELIQTNNNGKCQFFPMPVVGDDDPTKCFASGMFYLSDKELPNGTYTLKVITPYFEVSSELIVSDELVSLEIPPNDYLRSSIKEVYPIPKDLLFGSIVYQGSNNTDDAVGFLDYLENLGLNETTVPNNPYRHLSVDENGAPINRNWPQDNHLIGLLYNMNAVEFTTIFEESREYFNQNNVNLYLYTSNGDQCYFSKGGGISVVFAPN
jgi:hypothetical protein